MNRPEALAAVLLDIAGSADTIRHLSAISIEFSGEEGAAATAAAGLLARHVGYLADRLARTGGDPGRQSADAWLHDPLTVEALSVLESGKAR